MGGALPPLCPLLPQLTRLPRRTRRALQRQWKRSLAALALLLALGQAPALAATINVNTNTPGINDGDTFCSLIEAIENANADATHTDCPAGSPGFDVDTINLPANSTHTLTAVHNVAVGANGQPFGPNGLPVIRSAITIEGHGSTITRDGSAPPFRIFLNTDRLTLNETTVSGGTVSGINSYAGGGIANISDTRYSIVTLTNSTVSGNSANGGGGGVYSGKVFRLFPPDGSTRGKVILTNSTVSGNSASSGGGVDNIGGGSLSEGGTVTLTNSTVSGNSATGSGGGVSNNGKATLARTLISGNTAPTGAEVSNNASYVTVTANDFNLFGHSALTNAQAFSGFTPGASDITATSDCTPGPGCIPTALADILDTALMSNGGPTQTHALVAGSPAIDMSLPVDPNCQPTDQRGVVRPQDGDGDTTPLCDIGSFEILPPPTTTSTTTTTLPPPPTTTSTTTTTLPPPTTTTTTLPPPTTTTLPPTTTTTLPPTTTTTLPPPMVTCNGLPATIVGTDRSETLSGTAGNDVIDGLGGNDLIRGLGGKDVICGGAGKDSLFGQGGQDQLFGQGGNDAMDGGAGFDRGGGTDTAVNCEGTPNVP